MEILVRMNVPEWILRLIISYLEQQLMYVRFRGLVSTTKDMNGVFPQGTLLGGILYICYINPVGFPAEITNNPTLQSLLQDISDNIPSSDNTSSRHVLPISDCDPKLP